MKLAIIVPAYNEEKRIGRTLDCYSKYFEYIRRNDELDYRILVVINNTSDRTEEIVRPYIENNSRISYLNFKRGGKGFAVIEGFKYFLAARGDFDLIGFVDADMATSPEEYHKLIIGIGYYDGIVADRYLKSSVIIPKPSYKRLLASKLFNFVIRALFFSNWGDTQCGAKIFKSEALEEIMPCLSMSNWAFDVDLVYTLKMKGFKIKSYPTVWIDKEYSTINFWKAGPWMTFAVIRLRILNSPFRMFIRIYDKLIGFIPR